MIKDGGRVVMKIEAYVSMDAQPNEEPVFSIRLSDENSSFDIHDLTEAEVREIIKDIEDQIELYLETNTGIQALLSDSLRKEGG